MRLFYALWPDDDVRVQLTALQTQVSGRKVAPENLHLTLLFLGQQSRDLLPVLEKAMDALPSEPITLEIDRLGYFRKPHIAWAGPSAAPPSLFDLQHALTDKLAQLNVRLKASEGFRPHITLARDAAPTVMDAPPVIWQVKRLALIASISKPGGVSYLPLTERALA